MLLSRRETVVRLWMESHLGAAALVCAVDVIERAGGFPTSLVTVQAAAWIGYKMHTTCPSEQLSYFGAQLLHGMHVQDGLVAEEMRLLQAVRFYVPARTRVECAYAVGVDLDDAEVDKGVVLALLVSELCDKMTDAQYARCVVFAAAYKAGKLAKGLATEEVSKDYIMQWGMRIARQTE